MLLDEWCFYIKQTEIAAGTPVGELLNADEAGGVGKQQDLVKATNKPLPGRISAEDLARKKERKAKKLEELTATWKEFIDFIYSTVFELPHITGPTGVKTVPNRYRERLDKTRYVLQEQLFPYDIEEGKHFVMWYATKEQEKSNEEITADIEAELKKLTVTEAFQFGWYVNPKMTVPEFFHVQVFAKF